MATTSETLPDYTLITTCYFEEHSVQEFHRRVREAFSSVECSYEMIMINDGSDDGTFDKLRAIQQDDKNVRVIIDLFRNAGQAAAISAGIAEARGRYIILMDSDLQLAPEDLPTLIEKSKEDYDIVSGYRENRSDSIGRRIPSYFANIIMRKASHSSLRDFGCTLKIFDARLIQAFPYGPTEKFNQVDVIAQAGKIAEVPVQHFPRKYGKSGWTFGKLFAFNMDNMMRLSEKPFQWLAGVCLLGSVLLALRVLVGLLIEFSVMDSVTNALILYAVIIGLLLTVFAVAVLGEFVIRSFLRLQNRPLYIIRERIER